MHKVTLRVDDALHERLVKAADRDGRSLNREILWLAEDRLDNPPSQPIISGKIIGGTAADGQALIELLRAAGFHMEKKGTGNE